MIRNKGTTSTNYDTQFAIYTTALMTLRCLRRNASMSVTINDGRYRPWHDLVLHGPKQTICVQITVSNGKKLKASLAERRRIADEHVGDLVFARVAVAGDEQFKSRYPHTSAVPEALSLLLTNRCAYVDESTYFCMEQHDVGGLETEIRAEMAGLLGRVVPKAFLQKILSVFLEFVEMRFYRLVGPEAPLTDGEASRQLAFAILDHFKVPHVVENTCGDLSPLLRLNVVVLNHKLRSVVSDHVWGFLGGDGQNQVDEAWHANCLHMPLVSSDERTDRVVARALRLARGTVKVLVLRALVFPHGNIGKILCPLVGLRPEVLELDVDGQKERFHYAQLRRDVLSTAHRQLFAVHARLNDVIVEAHDQHGYLNEEVDDLTALIAAIATPRVGLDVVRALIELGADVNVHVIGGRGPLHHAVLVERVDIVELLLAKGAKPDQADKHGDTPLLLACLRGNAQLVEALVRHGADRNGADRRGVAPTFVAYGSRNFEVLKNLLTGNENPIAADVAGSHVLHRAAEDGDVECLECVVRCVADVGVFMVGDARGRTPLEIAREQEHARFAVALENALMR